MLKQSEFLKDLGVNSENEEAFLDKPLTDEVEPPAQGEDTPEEAEMKLKNRRERRLNDKLQSEREANIALNARLQGITESQTLRQGVEESDYLKRIEKIYGNATPEAKEATELLKEALEGVKRSAREEALTEFDSRRAKESEAEKEAEKSLSDMSDRWEDEYGIDMTDEVTRKGIFALTEKLSRKDSDGNIKEYPDPDGVAEVFIANKDKATNGRAKELASRGMTRSGASQPSQLQQDATWEALKEAGIF